MTEMTSTTHAEVGFRIERLSAIRNYFANLRAGMRDGREIEMRYRALSRMTPSQLADIGLTRSEVDRAALDGGHARPESKQVIRFYHLAGS